MNTAHLAATMLRLLLADMLLCRDEFKRADVQFWTSLLDEEEGALDTCRELIAYREAKRRLRQSRAGNPENVVAVLLYNVSRSGASCPQAQELWETRLSDGYRFDASRHDQVLTLIEELRGAYLSERQVGILLGRAVNLDRVSEMIHEEYEKLGPGAGNGT